MLQTTKNPEKILQGLIGVIAKKKINTDASDIVLKITDGFQTLELRENFPSFEIINEEFANPDEIRYELIIDSQIVKRGMLKEKFSLQKSETVNNSNMSQDTLGINFLLQAVTKSNEILAGAQEKNMSAMFAMIQTNTSATVNSISEQFKQMLTLQNEQTEHRLKLISAESEQKLRMQKEEFEFLQKKQAELDRISEDSGVKIFFDKVGGLLEKIPESQVEALTGFLIQKFTGQTVIIPSEVEDELGNYASV